MRAMSSLGMEVRWPFSFEDEGFGAEGETPALRSPFPNEPVELNHEKQCGYQGGEVEG